MTTSSPADADWIPVVTWADGVMTGELRWARWLSLLLALATALLVVCPLAAGIVHHHSLVIDTVAWLDASWRVAQGQIPNQDFSVQVGPFPFALTAAVMRTVTTTANALSVANGLVGSFVAIGGGLCLRRRYGAVMGAALTFALTAIATSPHLLDESPDFTSYAMLYNRWGWAMVGLVVGSAVVRPRTASSKRLSADAVVVGLALALVALTKPNLFVAGAATLLLANLSQSESQRRWQFQTAIVAVLALGFGTLLPYDLSGYIATWRTAAALRSGASSYLATDLFRANAELVLILAVIGFLGWNNRARPQWLVMLVVVVPSLLISLGNSHESGHWPLLFIAGAAATEIAWRRSHLTNPSNMTHVAAMLMLSLVVMIHSAAPDAYATLRATAWHFRHATGQELRLASQTYGPLIFPIGPDELAPEQSLRRLGRGYGLSPQEYVWACNDGLALLRRNAADRGRILCMDTVNPFPYALGAPPPRGDILTWHPHRSFDLQHAPTPTSWTADATHILEPLFPFDPEALAMKRELYGPTIDRDFELLDQSPAWRLYVRRKTPIHP